jgi:hypothetical protein
MLASRLSLDLRSPRSDLAALLFAGIFLLIFIEQNEKVKCAAVSPNASIDSEILPASPCYVLD